MQRLNLLAVMLSATLAGCSNDTFATKEAVCRSWLPISISRKDVLTDGTAKQIAGNNAASEVWCGQRPIAKEAPAKVASADVPAPVR